MFCIQIPRLVHNSSGLPSHLLCLTWLGTALLIVISAVKFLEFETIFLFSCVLIPCTDLHQKMDMGPCPKIHSLQLRKEYPFCLKNMHNILEYIIENFQQTNNCCSSMTYAVYYKSLFYYKA